MRSRTGQKLTAAALMWPLMTGAAGAEDSLRLGLVAPDDGTLSIFGEQAATALEAFAESRTDLTVEVVPAPEPCDDEGAGEAASSLIEAGVDAVVGLFCVETIDAAMPMLAESAIPAITVSVRAGIVMEDALSRGWPLFRLAPSAEAEARRIAAIIAERWADEPFALIEDGTIYGRDLAETVRLELEEMGITPSFIDNYRPAEEMQFGLVRRLASAGVSHVFVGGDRSDVAVMARDAAAADLGLTFMGGDAMRAADGVVPLPDGVYAVTAQRPRDLDAQQEAIAAIETVLDERGSEDVRPTDGYHLPLFAAAEILAEAKKDATSMQMDEALRSRTFKTAIGDIAFGRDQAIDGDTYRLTVSRNGSLRPVSPADTETRQD
ncbi:ABC transporter substrate-binding protein [Pararhizobium haloflavum]|uniref:ABC transporter substrate-binding protein n=1 Tax=Pararhizobium haloflavum TaxID=2037914 RepID=UPI000C17DA5A|nr:ABC transporter substrate-binding protein [Pararhizobium haloflavum]